MNEAKKFEVHEDFMNLVNMSAEELKKWLDTDQAKSVGWTSQGLKRSPGGEKSEGYKSGERIIDILSKPGTQLTEDDYAHMRRVNGYIKRHLGQQPNKDITNTRWRFSLMNWGHDPLK